MQESKPRFPAGLHELLFAGPVQGALEGDRTPEDVGCPSWSATQASAASS